MICKQTINKIQTESVKDDSRIKEHIRNIKKHRQNVKKIEKSLKSKNQKKMRKDRQNLEGIEERSKKRKKERKVIPINEAELSDNKVINALRSRR